MLGQVDHPLTLEGVAQARRLNKAVSKASAAGDKDALRFTAAETKVRHLGVGCGYNVAPLTSCMRELAVLVVGRTHYRDVFPESSEVISSPLTRAVATTVLAVGQERPIRLVPEAPGIKLRIQTADVVVGVVGVVVVVGVVGVVVVVV
eukprot:996964-Amphidinium_carterae.2